jgi:hypothetical protein
MTRAHPFIRQSCLLCALVAASPPPARAADEGMDEAGTSRQELLHALQEVQKTYGSDAVMMQGQLLGQAIRSGSILEAGISIPGVEERSGKRFLAFKVDTGIIYNDRELSAAERPARAWTDIIEVSLRKFRQLSLPADGVAIMLTYNHRPYADLTDMRARLHEGHGALESLTFYLLLADVGEMSAERISAQELVDRSTVLVDGAPIRVRLAAATPGPE